MKILCFIGPSGSGKSTVISKLQSLGVIQLNPSYTDRPIRNDEIGNEHVFLTKREFDTLESNGEFLEVVKPFKLNYRYGLSAIQKASSAAVPTVALRENYVTLMLKYYPDLVIYQIESSYDFSNEQVIKRGDIDIGTRLEDFKSEAANGRLIANRVFNNNGDRLDQLVAEMLDYIKLDFNNT